MQMWQEHMPKGMLLKSDGFASNIYDPDDYFTLKRFCSERGIEYGDIGVPVRLETFAAYGIAFQQQLVPELENKAVAELLHSSAGFRLRLADGEIVTARRVVLALGITHFDYVPANLAHLPPELLSHSARHHDLEPFRGRRVTVIGGGSSAIDLAGLLHDADAEVQLIARRPALKFHGKPQLGRPRSLWERIRSPQSGLGPGLRARFFSDAPMLFRYLPEALRLWIVRTHLGPSAGWFIKDKVVGRVPLLLGYAPENAEIRNGKVCLQLRATDGTQSEIETDHIIAATGYKVDIDRLTLLGPEVRSRLKTVERSPILSSSFESSIPGLYFVGVAAANSFGPVMRFAFGAGFTARRLSRALAKSLPQDRAANPIPRRPSSGTDGVAAPHPFRRVARKGRS